MPQVGGGWLGCEVNAFSSKKVLAYSIHPVMASPLRSSLSESAVDEGGPSVGSEVLEPSLREVPVTQSSCARTHAQDARNPHSKTGVSRHRPAGMSAVGDVPRWGNAVCCDAPGGPQVGLPTWL